MESRFAIFNYLPPLLRIYKPHPPPPHDDQQQRPNGADRRGDSAVPGRDGEGAGGGGGGSY
jgi:hypothetical protein